MTTVTGTPVVVGVDGSVHGLRLLTIRAASGVPLPVVHV